MAFEYLDDIYVRFSRSHYFDATEIDAIAQTSSVTTPALRRLNNAKVTLARRAQGFAKSYYVSNRLYCTNRPDVGLPLTQTDLAYGYSTGYAKNCEAVEDRGADLDLCNQTLEVARRKALAKQFYTMHPLTDRASLAMSREVSFRRDSGGNTRSGFATESDPGTLRIAPLRCELWRLVY